MSSASPNENGRSDGDGAVTAAAAAATKTAAAAADQNHLPKLFRKDDVVVLVDYDVENRHPTARKGKILYQAEGAGSASTSARNDDDDKEEEEEEEEEEETSWMVQLLEEAGDDASGSGDLQVVVKSSYLRHFAVDSRDDLDKAVRWMTSCECIDPKGLAKYLSHTAQGLRDGHILPEHLAADLGHVFIDTTDDNNNVSYRPERMKEELLGAATAVSQGTHEASKTCWECGTSQGKILECSRCTVATYCGRDCQLAAWKAGHKKTCKMLKQQKDTFEDELKCIDRFHAGTNSALNIGGVRVTLNYQWDLRTASSMLTLPKTNGLHGTVAGPSMEYFYKNLVHVACGDWWPFLDSDKIYFPQNPDLEKLLVALAYDCHGYVLSAEEYDRNEHSRALGLDPMLIRDSGMSAEDFLGGYMDGLVPQNMSSALMSRLRRDTRVRLVHHMRLLEVRRVYRFEVGAQVICQVEPEVWLPGKVIQLDYREDHWPEGTFVPYQVELENGTLIYAPKDTDVAIKRKGEGAQRAHLRFEVGTEVLCNGRDGWQPRKIIKLLYRESHWLDGVTAAYQVDLDRGEKTFALCDTDDFIKLKPGAN